MRVPHMCTTLCAPQRCARDRHHGRGLKPLMLMLNRSSSECGVVFRFVPGRLAVLVCIEPPSSMPSLPLRSLAATPLLARDRSLGKMHAPVGRFVGVGCASATLCMSVALCIRIVFAYPTTCCWVRTCAFPSLSVISESVLRSM